jgi:hypothetical protein
LLEHDQTNDSLLSWDQYLEEAFGGVEGRKNIYIYFTARWRWYFRPFLARKKYNSEHESQNCCLVF